MKQSKKIILALSLVLTCSAVSAQTDENAYLRMKVDSLERVIRNIRRSNRQTGMSTLSQTTKEQGGHYTRTGYYDTLGNLDDDPVEGEIQTTNMKSSGKYDDVNFFSFPYENRIDEILETSINAQSKIWSGILGRWLRYRDSIEKYFIQKGLPKELAMLCVIESGCSAKARSNADAAGFWQFMPYTAQDLGLRVDGIVDERLDVDKSTAAAVKFITSAYKRMNSWDAAIASYNWGTGNIERVRQQYGNDITGWYDHIPEETKSYLPALIAALWLANHYQEVRIIPSSGPEDVVAIRVTYDISFTDISGITGIPVAELQRQNPQYIQGVIPGSEGTYYLKANARYKNNLYKL